MPATAGRRRTNACSRQAGGGGAFGGFGGRGGGGPRQFRPARSRHRRCHHRRINPQLNSCPEDTPCHIWAAWGRHSWQREGEVLHTCYRFFTVFGGIRRPVAQVSQPAVSPISQSAECGGIERAVLGVKPCICTIPTASDCASMAYKPQTTHIGAGKTRNGTLAFVGSSTFSVGGTVVHAAGACSADFQVCCIAGFPARWPHRKSCIRGQPCFCTVPSASDCASSAYKPQPTTQIRAGKTRNCTLAFVGSSTFSVGGTVVHAAGACSADFQVCCIAGFPARWPHRKSRAADLEIGDTAGLETCATGRRIPLETSRKPHWHLFKA